MADKPLTMREKISASLREEPDSGARWPPLSAEEWDAIEAWLNERTKMPSTPETLNDTERASWMVRRRFVLDILNQRYVKHEGGNGDDAERLRARYPGAS